MRSPALNRIQRWALPLVLYLLQACGGGSTKTPEATQPPVPPPSLAISGTITGDGAPAFSLALSGQTTVSATSDAKGQYRFSNLQAGSYTVTPSLTGYRFTPANRAVTTDHR